MTKFTPLEVASIKNLTPNAVAVSFRIPEDLRKDFDFKAGQYITIRHGNKENEIRRAYSIASQPGNQEMTIGIKKVKGGAFSVYANEEMRAGDMLEVMEPEGRFVFESQGSSQQVLAFAAGSGITPVMSIIQTALEDHPETQVVLVYGNQNKDETMFFETLRALEQKYSERFFVHYLFSRKKEEEGRFGRIDRSIVNYITRNKHKDLNPGRLYVCGPLLMIEEVTQTLMENGVAEEKIYHELFTEPEGEDLIKDTLQGVTHLEVTLDEMVHNLDVDQKSLVLDAVLKADIDAPYSCQGGVCSTCIARVTEGSAKMVKNQILTDGELEEGFILTCQAHPTSTVLKIDYDNV